MPQVNNTGVGYDVNGTLVQIGEIKVDDNSQLTPPQSQDIVAAEGPMNGQTATQALGTIAGMNCTPANVGYLQAVLTSSQSSALITAAQTKLAQWGEAVANTGQ